MLHKGQYRASGEAYICHNIAVADLLKAIHSDNVMIAAAFLHDILEDTDVTAEEIESHFGADVRQIVERLTKLSRFQFSVRSEDNERQAENYRRMYLAIAQDIRVIVVKLADRLHNMRTLQYLPAGRQLQKARETIEIFAPLANRLGIEYFRWQLEDLSFKYLEPENYLAIQSLISEDRMSREKRLEQVAATIRERLECEGIYCIEISSRPKHFYSIHQKMRRRQKDFHQLYDIAGIRLIVSTEMECYQALAVVHDVFQAIPGGFQDYISRPKTNRYQSLHTNVIGSQGRPIEVQIRTMQMHHIACYGTAAEWKYLETGESSNVELTENNKKYAQLHQLLDSKNVLTHDQKLSKIENNIFDEAVYVFSPRGDVFELPQGATPVDFAYCIDNNRGHHCAGAKVNDRAVSLDTQLKNGDIVEILTNSSNQPSLDWLNFVVSDSARSNIRHWYQQSRSDDYIARGRAMLEKKLGKDGLKSLLKSAMAKEVARRNNFSCVDDMLLALGFGEITLNSVIDGLQQVSQEFQNGRDADDEALQDSINDDLYEVSTQWHKNENASNNTSGRAIIGVEGLPS